MPKFPALTAKRVVQALKKAGFIEDRQKGSHLVMIHLQSRCDYSKLQKLPEKLLDYRGDLKFYEKVSPVIGRKKYFIPPPTHFMDFNLASTFSF